MADYKLLEKVTKGALRPHRPDNDPEDSKDTGKANEVTKTLKVYNPCSARLMAEPS